MLQIDTRKVQSTYSSRPAPSSMLNLKFSVYMRAEGIASRKILQGWTGRTRSIRDSLIHRTSSPNKIDDLKKVFKPFYLLKTLSFLRLYSSGSFAIVAPNRVFPRIRDTLLFSVIFERDPSRDHFGLKI